MEKVNSQLSSAVEEVTREHREKAEVSDHLDLHIDLIIGLLEQEASKQLQNSLNFCSKLEIQFAKVLSVRVVIEQYMNRSGEYTVDGYIKWVFEYHGLLSDSTGFEFQKRVEISLVTIHLDMCWQIVKHHPHEVGRERQVFVDFFCAPDRLRTQVRELSARVMALQTQNIMFRSVQHHL